MDRTTIVFLIATFVAFWIIKNRLRSQKYLWTSRRRGCEPVAARYPHLDPFFGLDLVFEKWKDFNSYQFSEGMRRRHDKQGTTFLSNDLGKCCINTIDPKNVMAITTTHFDDYGKSSWTKEAEKHIGRGILMNDGERWKRSRAMLQPIFTRASRDEPSATMDGHVQQLIDVILQKKGEAFDFRMLSSRFMLDTVTRSLFGNATNVLGGKDEEAEDFLHCVSQFEAVSTAFIGMGPLALLRIAFRYGKILAYVRSMQSFFRSKITKGSDICKDDSQESSRTTTDFLKNLEIQGLDMTELQGELQNVFFASYDTTAALLANIFDVLGRRPDVQYHLRNEIASVVQGRSPFIYDLSRMKYLRNTIWESMQEAVRPPKDISLTYARSSSLLTRNIPLAKSYPRHHPAAWRWSSWSITHLDPKGNRSIMVYLCPQQSSIHLRCRQLGLQARTLGGLGDYFLQDQGCVHAFRLGAAAVHWTTDRAVEGVVCGRPVAANVFEHRVER